MADLKAKFQLIDEMTDKMSAIAESGQSVADSLEDIGRRASQALDTIPGSASNVVASIDGVATSIDQVSSRTEYWTDAVGNYSKEALEAIYSTEELVDMGLKSADALQEQEQAMQLCERMATNLSNAVEASANIENDLQSAIEKANSALDEHESVVGKSTDASDELKQASEQAAQAMEELENAQKAADAAMSEYNSVLESGTTDLDKLEQAAATACNAAENLAEANGNATEATEALAQATEKANQEVEDAKEGAEKSGKSGVEAINGIASALAAAGITATVKEIAEATYEMVDGFSEAEKIISASSGATGAELDSLMESAQSVYANSNAESLEQIADGMASVRTATNLTGEALESATEKGYELENLFGFEMSESARTASALMKNFGIDAEDAYDIIAAGAQNGANKNGDMLDVLNEYSTQYAALGLSAEEFITTLTNGAEAGVFSIDKVGDAVKEFNIRSKDGSDTSAAAFELLGMNADTMTAKFAAGGDTASEAFYQVVGALEAMDDPVAKNAAAVGLFGTQYEDLESNLLPILSDVQNGTLDTADALAEAADQSASLSDQWTQAGNNIKTAFTTAIEPTVSDMSEGMASLASGVGDFLNEHPVVTKAITAIGVGLGVAAVGVAAVSAASLTAIPAVAALGTAINAAIWPLTAVAAGVAAVSAAVLILKGNYDDAYDETMSMTAVTAQQTEELESLEAQYEEACEKYGETSEEASALKYQIDDLSASLNENGQSVEELCSEVDDLIADHDELMSSYDETAQSIKDEELNNLALIAKLDTLADSTTQTAASQQAMQTIIDTLNGSVDGLNISYEDLITNQDATIASMRQLAQAQADQQNQAALWDEYVELLGQAGEEEEELAKLTDEATAAQERANDASHELQESWKGSNGDLSGWKMFWSWTSDEQAANDAAQEALDEVTDKQEELNSAYEETTDRIAEIEEELGITEGAQDSLTEQTMTYQEAAATAYQEVQAGIESLCEAYDEAYQAALESFEGQFGLFDEASTTSEEYLNSTVANAQAALDSQLAYWESYNANLETLTSYGETLTGEARDNYETLLSYAQSGSEEAAGLAASMAEAIESGDTDAIAKLSETVEQVEAKQEEAAATTADWQTNFTEQMNQYQQDMEKTISDMDLSEEAKTSATATVNSYAESIRAGKSGAVSAAKEVASAVSAALASANTTVSVKTSTGVAGHAHGTTNAESIFVAGEAGHELVARPAAAYATGTTDSNDYFIAGENGPELIVGEQGSTVFPTSETDRLIDSLNSTSENESKPIFVPDSTGTTQASAAQQDSGNASDSTKHIVLEINGGGAIDVSSGTDENTVLEILMQNVKPVLMSIMKQEIYEEGELAYDY